jgi:hypothetical protein
VRAALPFSAIKARGGGAVLDSEFFVNPFEVFADGAWGNHEDLGYLTIRLACGQPAKDCLLSFG